MLNSCELVKARKLEQRRAARYEERPMGMGGVGVGIIVVFHENFMNDQ